MALVEPSSKLERVAGKPQRTDDLVLPDVGNPQYPQLRKSPRFRNVWKWTARSAMVMIALAIVVSLWAKVMFDRIEHAANVSGVWVSTAAAADYNNDGRLDLYLGRYLDPRTDLPSTNFYTRNGQGNTLLRNDGNLHFTDVTDVAGVREGGLSLGIAWGDYDRDGDQDVYVANDFGRNALFRNNGDETFSDVSKESNTLDVGYGMSASFEDIDNDGDLDLYVAAVHSGQRWFGNSATLQRYLVTSIQEGTIFEDYPLYREIFEMVNGDWQNFGEQVIRGNSLMLNNADGTFVDVTERCRVNPHGWYWSSAIFDFDNDCTQDIYTVNGWVTGKVKDDL